ncbi:hypothetical protein [Budvicia diplopodorum]|nr:hypothetical protein [Budvicia diplopodorum]
MRVRELDKFNRLLWWLSAGYPDQSRDLDVSLPMDTEPEKVVY